MKNIKEFKGECMGVRLSERNSSYYEPGMVLGDSKDDKHIMVEIMVEDDDNWFVKESMSSAWLDELIEQLQMARKFMDTQKPDIYQGTQYGWKFKK